MPKTAPQTRHFVDLWDWSAEQIKRILKEAARLKKAHRLGKEKPVLHGRVLGMIFEKPSLRTRISFQAGMAQMGGQAVFLSQQEIGLGKRESLADVARTISQYVDALVLRVFEHRTVEEFARWATVPVINGLSDYAHPCQALGDLLTIREACGQLAGVSVVFVGDGNNVARSLALACGKLDMKFTLCAPKGYHFDRPFLERIAQDLPGDWLHETHDPHAAVSHADVIYTDVWASMGQENEADSRKKKFKDYQVNGTLIQAAPQHCRVMHCLPAHRGEEITDDVMESEQSVVFDQAGNRMHAQKALLRWVFGV
jgi:ornithine carbamoyltransferase